MILGTTEGKVTPAQEARIRAELPENAWELARQFCAGNCTYTCVEDRAGFMMGATIAAIADMEGSANASK